MGLITTQKCKTKVTPPPPQQLYWVIVIPCLYSNRTVTEAELQFIPEDNEAFQGSFALYMYAQKAQGRKNTRLFPLGET